VILVDTSILSRVFRRRAAGAEEKRVRARFEELLAGDDRLGLPGTVLQEILSGIRQEDQFDDLRRRLLASFTILNADTDDHVEAARLRNRCLALGLNASGPDCLIAVQAIRSDSALFALDRDFEDLSRHVPLKLHRVGI
jgi:predicted nucleic acid-binding protein